MARFEDTIFVGESDFPSILLTTTVEEEPDAPEELEDWLTADCSPPKFTGISHCASLRKCASLITCPKDFVFGPLR